jgi:histidinol-phosphate aminotransferase
LQAAVADYAGVKPENIVLGNGGDEIIDFLVRLFVAPGQGVIVCPPAFGMYTVCAKAHRAEVQAVPRRQDAPRTPFAVDVEGIERLVAGRETDIEPRLLFITSPGNPDGQAIPPETIQRLLHLLPPHRGVAVVVDEAYIEFGGQTVISLLEAHPNLVVLRTFSKWAGMAGLRLGYAVAPTTIAEAMARLKPPYNVNVAAVVAALGTFDDMERVERTISRIVAERERLYAALEDLPGAHPVPSQANFVLCRFDHRSGPEIADALAAQGILVRSFSAPTLADALRISVGRPEQNDALLTALGTLLAPAHGQSPAPGVERRQAKTQPSTLDRTAGRRAEIHRQTRETDVTVSLDLDGAGRYEADTGLGFLDHMLAQLASHGLFDLTVRARGDLEVDEHHTVEDVAIGLGQALDAALGGRQGLVRMGQAYAPLDEALAHVVVDLSGRPYAMIEVAFTTPSLGAVGTDLIVHFLETLAMQARLSLHARVLYGRNDHHKAEALFKALGRAVDAASRLEPRRHGVPSTKGVL